MADETPAAGNPAPTPADMPPHAPQEPQEPQDGPKDDGRGGKDQILADLAAERDKRQELEAQFSGFRDAFAKALGLDKGEQLTPEQLTAQVTEQTGRAEKAERMLAVTRAIPATVDADALLDSAAFQRAVGEASADKVAETVTAFVADHPRFLRTNPAAGGRDLNEAPAPTGELDPIAAEILSKIGR